MAPPAGQRLPEIVDMARRHPDEGRRAGTAIEVLVGAAHGEVGLGALQVHRHRAGGVRQVPDRQRAALVRQRRHRAHVVHLAAAIVDVRQQHHGHGIVQRLFQRQLVIDQAHLVALLQQVDQALDHVQVGREVVALGQDHPAARPGLLLDAQRGGQRLEDVQRGGVGDDDLALAGADQARQLVAQAGGQVEPAGRVPAADEARAPFLADHVGGARRRGPGQYAQRVAIQVDHAGWQVELVLDGCQRVEAVCGDAGFAGMHENTPGDENSAYILAAPFRRKVANPGVAYPSISQ